MPIRKLPTLLINQIAAGEVIERPASVVKELVENSLDAGATRIEIVVEDGGRQLIRVSDDGGGIAADELALAVAPHATSKLSSAEELAAIRTLGFRGEALASIASVSRLRLTSRPRDAEAGATLEASGDDLSPVAPAATRPGTVIEVRDLFFNTPARRKFMRTASTEFGHISDTVSRLAMVHHRVGFRLLHGDRVALDLPAGDDRARRAVAILGREMEEALLEFEQIDPPDRGGSRLWGMAGLPSLGRATGKFQYLYVNGRAVRDRNLQHAVKEAYRGLMPPDRQPVVVVFLELDPASVDVNVHPAKAEVRFRNPSRVHGLVLATIRQRLLGADLTPSASVAGGSGSGSGGGSWRFGGEGDHDAPGAAPSNGASGVAHGGGGSSGGSIPSARDFVDYFRRMDPTQKGFVYEQVKQAVSEDNVFAAAEQDEQAVDRAAAPRDEPAGEAVRPRDILQVHKSYVVTQDDDGLVIVDQHALHERIMFEELRRRVLGEGRTLESQRLLMPAVIRADAGRQALLEELQPLLQRIGIEAEPIGPDAVGIQAFPTFLFDRHVEPVEFMEELLDKAESGELSATSSTAEESALHEVLDMMACKAAVKAGDRMTEAELAALLAKRAEIERSSNCPHGRPTTIRLTLRDLERQFGRT